MKETTDSQIIAGKLKADTEEVLDKYNSSSEEGYFRCGDYGEFNIRLYKERQRKKHKFLGKEQILIILFEAKEGKIQVFEKEGYQVAKDIGEKLGYKELVKHWGD